MLSVYRVQEGDTLSKIAKQFGMTLTELADLNPQVEDINFIKIGQPINIELKDGGIEESSDSTLPKWYLLANEEMDSGVEEIPGKYCHNPRIIEYHQTTTLKATDDETPWCSSFVNWCMVSTGYKGTNSAAARSWIKWGIKLDVPKEGCVVVLKRGNSSWQGHVGFFVDIKGDQILVLGGNQGNEINISSYPKSKLLGYRWIK